MKKKNLLVSKYAFGTSYGERTMRYDSGGKKKYRDDKKFNENFDKIFKKDDWPCKECENTQRQGHTLECSKHWRNNVDS